jgi:hypothetical protein
VTSGGGRLAWAHLLRRVYLVDVMDTQTMKSR